MEDYPEDLLTICTQDLVKNDKEWNYKDEIDHLLSQVPSKDIFDAHTSSIARQKVTEIVSVTEKTSIGLPRFATPATDADIKKAQESCIPTNTKKATSWCLNVWRAWSDYRKKVNQYNAPPHIFILAANKPEFSKWLCCFVLEVRRQDGKEYPPNSLHQLCCGILRYARERMPELDFFRDPSFAPFQKTLDGEMKRLRALGHGSAPKRAEPISLEEEEKMWTQGVLGDSSPKQLIETILYMCGLYFAMRSETEHHCLRDSDIEIVERPGQTPYVVYNESSSKNNSGGLKHRKVKPKRVIHYANTANPSRCFIKFLKKYREHQPPKTTPDRAFYLTPIPSPTGKIWYKTTPMGVNTIRSTVRHICAKSGIEGYKTNHSLRVTAATRLYHNGVDEQLIMERTGHRSLDGVRCYKRSSKEQQRDLSNVLNGCEKKPKLELEHEDSVKGINDKQVVILSDDKENIYGSTSASSKCVLNLTGCSGITVNYNFK